jgi:hypothetical protein
LLVLRSVAQLCQRWRVRFPRRMERDCSQLDMAEQARP